MALLLRAALVASIAVALLAFIMRPRFPDTASNHTLKTLTWGYIGFTHIVATTGELFGFSKINISRAFYDVGLIFDWKLDTVEEYITHMDGVEVTVFQPAGQVKGLRPGLVHFHGGGWVLMTPANYGSLIRHVVESTQSVVVSVNYRRAPEHVFPIPIEDCLRATRYFLKHAEQYGVDPNRIGVKGDSAGGNLAMAATLRLAKEADPELPTLKCISLDYPALQAFDFDLPSYQKHEHGPGFLRKDLIIKYWISYAFGHRDYFDQFYANTHMSAELRSSHFADYLSLDYLPTDFTDGYRRDSKTNQSGDKELSDKIQDIILDPLFSPLLVTDEELRLLPPTHVMNAEFDVLRDEGFILTERLRRIGVDVEHSFLSSEEHGVLNLIVVDQAGVDENVKFAKFFKRIMG